MERIFTRQILSSVSKIELKLLLDLFNLDLGLRALLSLFGSDLLQFPGLEAKLVVNAVQEGLNFSGLFFVKSKFWDMRVDLKFKFVDHLQQRSLVLSIILMGEGVVRGNGWDLEAVDH